MVIPVWKAFIIILCKKIAYQLTVMACPISFLQSLTCFFYFFARDLFDVSNLLRTDRHWKFSPKNYYIKINLHWFSPFPAHQECIGHLASKYENICIWTSYYEETLKTDRIRSISMKSYQSIFHWNKNKFYICKCLKGQGYW